MTKKQFDNFRFSIRTKAKYLDKWYLVSGVNFVDRLVLIIFPKYVEWIECREIESLEDSK